jgi:hypothetical protein
MMSIGYLLDIVLDHRCSTDDLDVDRHARTSVPMSEIQGEDQSGCLSVASSSARPNVGRYRPKFNSKSLGTP